MTDGTDETPETEEAAEPHILSAEEILAADDLERWDVPEVGVTLIEATVAADDALTNDARDDVLDDRAFAVRAVARQTVDPVVPLEAVEGWEDERLLAALASLAAHDTLTDDAIEPFSIAAYREAIKARYAAMAAQVKEFAGDLAIGPFGKMNASLAAMVKSQADLSGLFRLGAGVEAARIAGAFADPAGLAVSRAAIDAASRVTNLGTGMTLSKLAGRTSDTALADLVRPSAEGRREFVVRPSPNYAAKTAGGIERIASFQAASIEMAAAQRDEMTALNAKVEQLTARADTTNDRLTDLVKSTTPRWVFYLTLLAAIGAIVATVLFSQPRLSALVATPTPIVSAVPSPS